MVRANRFARIALCMEKGGGFLEPTSSGCPESKEGIAHCGKVPGPQCSRCTYNMMGEHMGHVNR